MKMDIKYLIIAFGFLPVFAPAFGSDNRTTETRLQKANSLFEQKNIVHNFSHMKDLFPAVKVSSLPIGEDFVETPSPLVPKYNYGGETRKIVDGLKKLQTTSLLVLHQGDIKFEEYYLGTARDDFRITLSISKSMISTLIGIALDKGKIHSLDDPVIQYAPELANSAYKDISIRNVLQMASGIRFNENPYDLTSDMNKLQQKLALGASVDEYTESYTDIVRQPGTKRDYVSIDTQVLAMVLRGATGLSVPKFHAKTIWSKMGNGSDLYYLTDSHGVALAFAGINMRTRDLARFGQLFLNKGEWNGQQIVSADWVEKSTKASALTPANPLDSFQYGYQWWIPQHANQEYFARGAYGQYIYINPKAQVIIVKTAANLGARFGTTEENIAIFRAIVEHYTDWEYPGPGKGE